MWGIKYSLAFKRNKICIISSVLFLENSVFKRRVWKYPCFIGQSDIIFEISFSLEPSLKFDFFSEHFYRFTLTSSHKFSIIQD